MAGSPIVYAGSINYLYAPNQTVWVITACSGSISAVRSGVVIQVRGTALITETTVRYDIRLDGDKGTTEFVEANVFATLAEAVAEYESRLTP